MVPVLPWRDASRAHAYDRPRRDDRGSGDDVHSHGRWKAWTALLLVPPLLVGVVGLGRYANECFPPFVAGGQLLERWPAWARRTVFAVSIVGLCFAGVMVIRFKRIP
jgi:hypothetical protein